MSWKPEVIADSSGEWAGNGLRFATKEEAEANVLDLACRWTSVREWRAVEAEEPANYRWVNRRLELIEEPKPEPRKFYTGACDENERLIDERRIADRIDGYDRDDLGECPDY